MEKDLQEKLVQIKERVLEGLRNLQIDKKEIELDLLQEEVSKPDFWNNQENAKSVSEKVSSLKETISPWREIEKTATELLEVIDVAKGDAETLKEIDEKATDLLVQLEKIETLSFLSGKFDNRSILLSIYAGAGGVDAQDWAEMLLSMYLKYSSLKNFKSNIIQLSPGTEAGVKSVTVEISGPMAYGLLKSESGVHRLIRISPYDADKARHTSFALVEVIPEFDEVSLDIPDNELRIETYRASGHGGQSVNTTDSAVRITHIPTNTVVTCQNERSQLQNRETALKVLKSRLQSILESEREQEIKVIKGESLPNEWGSQIRSYVLHPYQMVKDHRTGYETSSTDDVLSGKIDDFIDAFIRKTKSS